MLAVCFWRAGAFCAGGFSTRSSGGAGLSETRFLKEVLCRIDVDAESAHSLSDLDSPNLLVTAPIIVSVLADACAEECKIRFMDKSHGITLGWWEHRCCSDVNRVLRGDRCGLALCVGAFLCGRVLALSFKSPYYL